MLRYLIQGQINLAYVPKVLVNMRLGGESNRSLERIARKSLEDLNVIRHHNIGGVFTLAAKNISKIKQFL
jgi:glycosyltransferase